jgi:hypothetical protein
LSTGYLGHGIFSRYNEFDYNTHKYKEKGFYWSLDSDALNMGEVTHYMIVEYPENE